jgi:DNA-binding IclR family transcriptional regulator
LNGLARSLAIIDLFSAERPVWTAESIIQARGLSRPTGYRYVRELLSTGLLIRVGAGAYSLGPRIIELDRLIRHADPMMVHGMGVVGDLVATTGCDVMLAALYGDRIVTTHQEPGLERLRLSFGRGQALPLHRGAGSKIILAYVKPARLARLYEPRAAEFAAVGFGASLGDLRASLATIRRAGHATSAGELDPGFHGLAAPVFGNDGEILGSVIVALSTTRLAITDLAALTRHVIAAAARLTASIAAATSLPPPDPLQRRAA